MNVVSAAEAIFNEEKMLATYRAIMEQVRARIDTINWALGSVNRPSGWIGAEVCVIQIRKICELVALACLVAHGDIDTEKMSLRKKWDINDIMKRLRKLRPECYPMPVNISFPGAGRIHAEPIVDGYMDQDDLIQIYGRCGGFLHAGTLDKFIKGEPVDIRDMIIEFASRIITLLNCHRIPSPDGMQNILCILKDEAGQVAVAMAKAPYP